MEIKFDPVDKPISTKLRKNPKGETFPDTKDIIFYEVALSKEDSFLVIGNTKHFPKTPIVVTPAEFLEIISKK